MEKIIGLIIKKNRLEQNMSQESLCHGICAVSYLSKIENGSVKADMEIISKLFLELGITFSEVVSEEEEGEIYSALDNIFIEKLKFDRAKEILDKYSSMIYSTKVLTYLILEFIVKANEDFKSVDEKRFLAYENYADKKQLYYFYMVLGKFYLDFINDKEKALFYFEKAYMINPEGKGLFNIGVSYYIDGDYNRAIEYFNKDFILEIELGNIDDAVIDCIYLANTYSNLKNKNDNIIFIGKGTDSPENILKLFNDNEKSLLNDNCIIKQVESPFNKDSKMLILISNDDELLIKGSKLITSNDLIKNLNSSSIVINKDSNVEDLVTKERTDRIYLKDLGYENLMVKGPFNQEIILDINIPKNKVVAEGSKIKFDVRYAKKKI